MKSSTLKLVSLFIFAAVALIADQALKLWVVANLTLHHSAQVQLIPGYFGLTYTRNYGSAWSMLWGQTWLLIGIATAVAVGIIVYAVRLKERYWLQMAGLGFLLGGALGNLIDRARLGFVVDMFDLQNGGRNIFPIFNIADIAIDVGVALLLLFTFMAGKEEKKKAQEQDANVRPLASERAP